MRKVSLIFGTLMAALAMVLLTTAPANAATTGWTAIATSYGPPAGMTTADVPAFAVCQVAVTSTTITLKLRGNRQNNVAQSFAVNWSPKQDFSVVGGSAFAQWPAGTPLVTKVSTTFTLNKTDWYIISWQSGNSGYAYNVAKRPPLTPRLCP